MKEYYKPVDIHCESLCYAEMRSLGEVLLDWISQRRLHGGAET